MKIKAKFAANHYQAFKIKPYCIQLYNEYMNAIDVVDQPISSYERHQRAKIWKIVYFLTSFKMAAAAAYKLYCQYCTAHYLEPMEHCDYKKEIGIQLLLLNSEIDSTNTRTVPAPNQPTGSARGVNINDIHWLRTHESNKKCRWFKCDNFSGFSCGGGKRGGKPLYLCLKHLKEHRESEEARLMIE